MANTELFVECLCVCRIFFILICVFGCRESAEKIPINTSLTEGKMKIFILQSKFIGEQFSTILPKY